MAQFPSAPRSTLHAGAFFYQKPLWLKNLAVLFCLFFFFCFFSLQIEHFVDPKNKKHPRFSSLASKELTLFGRVRGITSSDADSAAL